MIKVLLLIVALAAAMLLGPIFVNNPGYIKIIVAGYVVEMTVLGFIIALVILSLGFWILGIIIRKLFRVKYVSFNFFRWRRQRKAQQAYELGLQAFAKQQWPQAAEWLNKASADSFMQTEKHLLAAYAEFYSGNQTQADEHVEALTAEDNNKRFVQADLLLRQNEPAKACAVLNDHVNADTTDKGLGQLYIYALQQAGQWQTLLQLVPAAIKHKWFDNQQWQQLRFAIYPIALSQLSQGIGFDEEAAYWQALPSKERKSTAAALGKAWALAKSGQTEAAEKVLASHLTLEQLPSALPYLKQIPLGTSVLKLRKQAQCWLRDNESNGYIYALLAHLAEQEGEQAHAAVAWQKALQYEPSLG
ncbi:heme biosynthesis HemY N-terminal domain-containing protein [Rheinheimera sp. WS51]|uniref:heme biosynthesis HemY N-terminal domain-containing protein n=1 Tax=Rheinheimera sp. WS51 TaxID=3425886 RepID=UPI003D9011F9